MYNCKIAYQVCLWLYLFWLNASWMYNGLFCINLYNGKLNNINSCKGLLNNKFICKINLIWEQSNMLKSILKSKSIIFENNYTHENQLYRLDIFFIWKPLESNLYTSKMKPNMHLS